DVKLLDSRFKQAMERNADYLLSLEPDRFLHNTRQYCGLQPKGKVYGGWESRGIAGHALGHYLTAISQQYLATGDKRFREKLDYTISEMAMCQERYGDGYIGALPPLELETLRGFKQGMLALQGGFGFKGGAWVPWYTEHKILAGLIDAWSIGGNEQAKGVALNLAGFIKSATDGLSPKQQQDMLGVEFGGMNEALADLYVLTGDKQYLDLSHRFYHHAVLDPLLAGKDDMPGKHANTQIPKIIGEAVTYEATGNPDDRKIAEFFWNLIVDRYTFAIGGNSDREHFFPPDQADKHLGPQTAETCNVYNMLKLTKHLIQWNPSVKYADFYERALYNQILGSQEPTHGMFTYFQGMKPGFFHTFSTPTESFWCCVGTGMENHTKYGEAIYFHSDRELYVNLFIPSELRWEEKQLTLQQETKYPETNQTTLTITSAPSTPITLCVRCPAWASGPLAIKLNSQPFQVEAEPGAYAKIDRSWKDGDKIDVTIPMGVRTEPLEGDAKMVAFLYGPVVLAGDFGKVPDGPTFPEASVHTANDNAPGAKVPPIIADDVASIARSLHRSKDDALIFEMPDSSGSAATKSLAFRPYNNLAFNYYNVYWNVVTPQQWASEKSRHDAEAEQKRLDQARLVDEVTPGEQQSEIDHAIASDQSSTGNYQDRPWRDARNGGHFDYRLKVLGDGTPQLLRVSYAGGDNNRAFQILIDGKVLATEHLNGGKPDTFITKEYDLPANLLSGKSTLTVRFQSIEGKTAGGVY
ncbi:MAG: glycoside hydrolase family 127 protein, partial [Phycisphaerae bacterium]|nr:glycoside hydrolase family 127 protein [Phycisphaerae bacterium]